MQKLTIFEWIVLLIVFSAVCGTIATSLIYHQHHQTTQVIIDEKTGAQPVPIVPEMYDE